MVQYWVYNFVFFFPELNWDVCHLRLWTKIGMIGLKPCISQYLIRYGDGSKPMSNHPWTSHLRVSRAPGVCPVSISAISSELHRNIIPLSHLQSFSGMVTLLTLGCFRIQCWGKESIHGKTMGQKPCRVQALAMLLRCEEQSFWVTWYASIPGYALSQTWFKDTVRFDTVKSPYLSAPTPILVAFPFELRNLPAVWKNHSHFPAPSGYPESSKSRNYLRIETSNGFGSKPNVALLFTSK